MIKRCLLILAVLTATLAQAQTGYKLDFRVKGLKDTVTLLGYYNGEGTYVRDTAKVDSHGAFTFEGTKSLQQGVFFVVLKQTPIVQFVIGANQYFAMTTDRADYNKHMVVIGDEDNKAFFENANFLTERFKEADPYVKILRDSTLKEDQKKTAREEFKKITQKVNAYQDELINNHPTFMTSRLLKSTREIEVPEPPKKSDGTIDSTWQFRYYRDHYFDNFDLTDDALSRLPRPVYAEKVKDYLNRLFIQQPDTLLKEINRLAAKTKKNPDAYKFFVWTCFMHYQNHEIMGLDEVYVKMFDKYVGSGEMDFWLDPGAKQSIKEYVDKVRLSLIGNTAPDLIMQDKDFKPKSMYDLKHQYTILYIFNPDCGHCREETPKLVEFYTKNKLKFDVEIYAVSTDTSMLKMKNFIKEFKMPWTTVNGPRTYVGHYSKLYYAETTPTMYVIDAKKKIIAKKLPVEKLGEFFEKYEKHHKKQPNGNKGT